MNYAHIGWMKEGNSDKVWGIIELYAPTNRWSTDGKYVSFWGRRGASLQTKIIEGGVYEVQHAFNKKLNKGYKEVDKNHLDEVYPEFQSDLEKTAFWAAFKV